MRNIFRIISILLFTSCFKNSYNSKRWRTSEVDTRAKNGKNDNFANDDLIGISKVSVVYRNTVKVSHWDT